MICNLGDPMSLRHPVYIHTCVGKRLTCNPHVAIKRPRTRQEPTNKTHVQSTCSDKGSCTCNPTNKIRRLTCNPTNKIRRLTCNPTNKIWRLTCNPTNKIRRLTCNPTNKMHFTCSDRVAIKRPPTRSAAVRHWHDLGSCSWALYCSCHASGVRSP